MIPTLLKLYLKVTIDWFSVFKRNFTKICFTEPRIEENITLLAETRAGLESSMQSELTEDPGKLTRYSPKYAMLY